MLWCLYSHQDESCLAHWLSLGLIESAMINVASAIRSMTMLRKKTIVGERARFVLGDSSVGSSGSSISGFSGVLRRLVSWTCS